MWPEWLTDSPVAIIVSLMSAAFTGGTLFYTRRLAKNDTAKMKRSTLVSELSPYLSTPTRPGWEDYQLVVRNLEPVGAVVHSIRSKRRGSCIICVERHRDNSDP